jgi:hypothetical protein
VTVAIPTKKSKQFQNLRADVAEIVANCIAAGKAARRRDVWDLYETAKLRIGRACAGDRHLYETAIAAYCWGVGL